MGRLRAAMTDRYKSRDEDVKIHTPRNLETLELTFRGERVAKAIGHLAAQPPQPGDLLSGLLVAKDYSYTLLDPRDLRDVGWELVRWHLEGMFGKVEEGLDKDGIPTIRVMGAVDVKQAQEHELILEWDSSASNDMIADSTLALITGIDKSPASVKLTTHPHSHTHAPEHPHPHADIEDETGPVTRIRRLAMFLEAHFGEVELHMPEDADEQEQEQGEDSHEAALLVRLDEADALINLVTLTVESTSGQLKRRVETVLDMALSTVSSLNESFTSGVPLLSEEGGLPETVKDKSGSPIVSLSGGESKPTLPAISEDAEHAEDAPEPQPQAEGSKGGEDTVDAQTEGETKSADRHAGEGVEEGDGDDDSESGTDDDAILQVHA